MGLLKRISRKLPKTDDVKQVKRPGAAGRPSKRGQLVESCRLAPTRDRTNVHEKASKRPNMIAPEARRYHPQLTRFSAASGSACSARGRF